jgi:hypothetical protein
MKVTINTTVTFNSFNDLSESMLIRIIESADEHVLNKIEDWLYTEYPAIGEKITDDVYRRRVELNKKYENDVLHTEKYAVWHAQQTFIG